MHCFEAFCAPGFHPLGAAMRDESLRLLELRNWLTSVVLRRAA